MVVRHDKRKRKYFGTRRWGVGNIKNARGKGGKGGKGNAGRGLGTGSKHKFTYITAYAPELIRKVGFVPWNMKVNKMREITLREIERRAVRSGNSEITLENFKVLGNGAINRKLTIKASKFSKSAQEKIKSAGGEAVKI